MEFLIFSASGIRFGAALVVDAGKMPSTAAKAIADRTLRGAIRLLITGRRIRRQAFKADATKRRFSARALSRAVGTSRGRAETDFQNRRDGRWWPLRSPDQPGPTRLPWLSKVPPHLPMAQKSGNEERRSSFLDHPQAQKLDQR